MTKIIEIKEKIERIDIPMTKITLKLNEEVKARFIVQCRIQKKDPSEVIDMLICKHFLNRGFRGLTNTP